MKRTALDIAADLERGSSKIPSPAGDVPAWMTEAAAELRRQHALILEMREALQMVGQCLAWQCFGECRSYGESVPLLGSADADRLAKETIKKASNE